MSFTGIIIGAAAFFLIGLFHPLVIKCEYYIGARIWPLFLVLGIICCIISILLDSILLSSVLAVLGFTFLWGIHELKEQEKRVQKGWFPKNPNRKK